jgi:hypothetical protein
VPVVRSRKVAKVVWDGHWNSLTTYQDVVHVVQHNQGIQVWLRCRAKDDPVSHRVLERPPRGGARKRGQIRSVITCLFCAARQR